MSEFGDMTMDQYRDALASNNPTPGGGTAAAVALSQGAALAIMVCNLTEGKEKWKDGWRAAEETRLIAEPLLERGYELAEDDSNVFDAVMSAYRMPKDDEQRTAHIHMALSRAANVPMQTARSSFRLLDSLLPLAKTGNANAVTDVGVSALLISAACKGGIFNAEINLYSLPSEMSEDSLAEMIDLRAKCSDVSRSIMQVIHDRMQS